MNRVIENNQNSYKPDMNLIVDEQLIPYKICINKCDKFGIKFSLASDTNSKYIAMSLPYLGKEEFRSLIPFDEFVVLKIVEIFTGRWRNIPTDNFFTSASLATKLLTKRTILFGVTEENYPS
ncbi:piggyBac transposable element-derived protein 4-like [Vespula maculifrons]|uniref:PiggyBac transposable element-derived protein 4-like n=1 Tax=Vespula maculifrons TaxID=7453 RepID=A0ABD2CB12_VESMC